MATQQQTRTYILYDARAIAEGTDNASVLVACESNREAKSYRGMFGAMACYSYADADGILSDERCEWSWYPRGH